MAIVLPSQHLVRINERQSLDQEAGEPDMSAPTVQDEPLPVLQSSWNAARPSVPNLTVNLPGSGTGVLPCASSIDAIDVSCQLVPLSEYGSGPDEQPPTLAALLEDTQQPDGLGAGSEDEGFNHTPTMGALGPLVFQDTENDDTFSNFVGKLPGLERKIRGLVDWTVELFFPKDIVQTIDLR